jgi:hypothetical protein
MSIFRLAIQGTALALGAFVLGTELAEGQEVGIPNDDYPKLVDYAVTGIKEALKDPTEDTNVRKARTAAVMLAAYAQTNLSGPDAALRATQRDAALKLADTIKNKKYADASKQADGIAKLKADPNAKKEKIKLIDTHVKLPDLMNQFDFPPKGGWGIDRDLYAYRLGMKSKVPTRELNDKLMLIGYQVAVTGDLAHSKQAPRDEKDWAQHTGTIRIGGVELADAVKKKDGEAAMNAIAKITTSCSGCHKAFRNR